MRFFVAKPFGKYATSRANRQTNSSFFPFSLNVFLLFFYKCLSLFFRFWERENKSRTKIKKNYSTNSKLMDSDQDRVCMVSCIRMQNGIRKLFFWNICLGVFDFAGFIFYSNCNFMLHVICANEIESLFVTIQINSNRNLTHDIMSVDRTWTVYTISN